MKKIGKFTNLLTFFSDEEANKDESLREEDSSEENAPENQMVGSQES